MKKKTKKNYKRPRQRRGGKEKKSWKFFMFFFRGRDNVQNSVSLSLDEIEEKEDDYSGI